MNTEMTTPTIVKPTLPESPLPALLDHDGRFQALYPEDLVVAHGDAMIAYERCRILALLDAFSNQCQAQGMALSESGHADAKIVNAQLDAVRLLQEAIGHTTGTPIQNAG